MSLIPHLINGELVTENGRAVDVFNPSTGQAIHKLPLATRETIQHAIEHRHLPLVHGGLRPTLPEARLEQHRVQRLVGALHRTQQG